MKTKIFSYILLLTFIALNTVSVAFAAEDDAPPEITFDFEDEITNDNPPEITFGDLDDTEVNIVSHSVFPAVLLPLTEEAKISYEIDNKAKITVEILKPDGSSLLKLINDETEDSGNHNIWWNGTYSNTGSGTIVPAGNYKYKIYAKDTETSETLDTAEGNITVKYPDITPTPTDSGEATVILQNTKTGKTSETGPSVLIYGLAPLAAYFYKKLKK